MGNKNKTIFKKALFFLVMEFSIDVTSLLYLQDPEKQYGEVVPPAH